MPKPTYSPQVSKGGRQKTSAAYRSRFWWVTATRVYLSIRAYAIFLNASCAPYALIDAADR